MRRFRVLPAAAGLVLATAAIARADTRITFLEQTRVTGPNERETAAQVTLWLSQDRAARIDSSGGMISRLDRGELYLVNDADQTYTVLPIESDNDAERPVPELVKTGESRTIGPWTAERYEMDFEVTPGETAHAVFWISADVDVDLDAYRAFTENTADAMGMSWLKAALSVEGYPVLQEMTVGIVEVRSEVRSIADETPPPGIYEPPAGYQRIE